MAAVNSIVSQADYNNIRNKIVSVMGVGSGNFGWGQQARLKSPAIVEGNNVTINEWANLRYDVINAYKHINGSDPTTAQVYEGGTIRYTSNFTPDTGANDVPLYQYDVWADNIVASRFTVGAGQYATSAPAGSATREGQWTSQVTCQIDFYWNTADEARYFFNSGGQIRVASSFVRTSGVNTAQNIAWESLLSAAGTQSFGGNNPGTGTTPNDGTNWYRLTQSWQPWYLASSSSPYTANYYRIYARCVDVPSNSSGTARWGQFILVFNDGYTDPGTVLQPGESVARNPADFPPGDMVDGTITVSPSLLYATGVMVPVGLGNFTVTNPTLAIASLSGS